MATAGALVALAVVAVVVVALRPYSNAGHTGSPASASNAGLPSAAVPAPLPAAAVATGRVPAAPPSAAPTVTPVVSTSRSLAPAPGSVAAHDAAPTSHALPERMKKIPAGTTQLLVATGAKIGANVGTFAVYNKVQGHWVQVLSTSASFGKNGLVDGVKRKQGHLQTPTGIWFLEGYVFGQHPKPPSGTKMPYRHITQRSWWSCEPNSTYNTWVESSSHVSGEHLADSTVQYQYAFDTGYNALPNERVIGRGTAIFLHCAEPPGNALGRWTHGCIAISPKAIVRVFQLVDPARRPCFAIGTQVRGSATSIYAY